MSYHADGLAFSGRLAVVRDRPGDRSLMLLDGSRLAFGGHELTDKGSLAL